MSVIHSCHSPADISNQEAPLCHHLSVRSPRDETSGAISGVKDGVQTGDRKTRFLVRIVVPRYRDLKITLIAVSCML